MRNCLVTKYNVVVDNNDLLRLDALTVQVNASNRQITCKRLATVGGTVTTIPVVIETTEGVTVTGTDTTTPTFNGTGEAYLYDVYHLYQFMDGIFSYKWKDLKRCYRLRYFDKPVTSTVDGLTSIEELNVFERNLERINYKDTANSPTIFGDLKDLNTPKLNNIDLRNTGITGNAAELGRFPITKIVALAAPMDASGHYPFKGTIEDMVAVRRGVRGDTTSTITWDYPSSQSGEITFNGARLTGNASNISLSWDATTITFNGTTINNDSVINQAQLEALRANGYQH